MKNKELKTNLKIEYIDDDALLEQLINIVLLAKKIAGKSKEESEKIQNNFLDNHYRL